MENTSNFSPAKVNTVLAEKLFAAIRTERKDEIEKYLCCGADPNFILLNGHSAFHLASGCERSHEFAGLILKYDGNPNVRNHEGQTPLHIATSWGRMKCMKLLVENGADVQIKDYEGKDLSGFATENGSSECMQLVEELLNQRLRLGSTSKFINEGQEDKKRSKYKENRMPNAEASDVDHIVNVRSPHHDRYDDSWIVKERGSAKRRHQYHNRKTSRNNSPSGSPAHIKDKTRDVPRSPCCKKVPEKQSKTDKESCSGCHFDFSPRKVHGGCLRSHGCLDFPDHQTYNETVHMPYILTHVVRPPSVSCKTCIARQNQNTRNANSDVSDKCTASSSPGQGNNSTRILINTGNVPCQASVSATNCDPNTGRDNLDTTDKCIGTSLLDPEVNSPKVQVGTDSVACQVTINESPDRKTAISSSATCSDIEVQAGCMNKNMVATTATPEDCNDSVFYASEMEDFLKGCDRFIDGDNKGLDVSSPDHCVSFMIGTDPASPHSIQVKNNADVVQRKKNVYISPLATEKSQQKNSVAEFPRSAPPHENATKKIIDVSLARSLLLSTKIPLSRSEMDKMYGQHTTQQPFVTQNFKITDVCSQSPVKDQTECPRDGQTKSTSEKSSFAFSEPTVPIENIEKSVSKSNSKITDVCLQSPVKDQTECPRDGQTISTPEKSSFTFSEPTVPIENIKKSVSESPSSPENHSQSSISLRRFAASRSELSKPVKNGDYLEKQSSCGSNHKNDNLGPESVSLVTANSRLHSTALSDSCDTLRFPEDAALDISIIKANGEIVSGTGSFDVFSQECPASKSPDQTTENSNRTPNQLLSSASSNTSNQSTIIYNWKTFWKGEPQPQSAGKSKRKPRKTKKSETSEKSEASSDEVPLCTSAEEIDKLSNVEIRNRLISLGYNPGPIRACREVYLKKLELLSKKGPQQRSDVGEPKFSAELDRCVMGNPLPDTVTSDDEAVRQQFEQPDPNLQWREGTTKNSFTYLLLDPRVTDKLPIRAKVMSSDDVFKSFVGAIFYVGKGKQSRPYSHFHEAMQTNILHYKLNPSRKIRHIHDIWEDGHGVISLHVFQSIIACEAYTREAAMIESVGLGHLTNLKRGEYYGVAASWDQCRKRRYGSYLIKKAMEILMVEGERQIRPANLKSQNARQWTR